jgi:hypothetical protein
MYFFKKDAPYSASFTIDWIELPVFKLNALSEQGFFNCFFLGSRNRMLYGTRKETKGNI